MKVKQTKADKLLDKKLAYISKSYFACNPRTCDSMEEHFEYCMQDKPMQKPAKKSNLSKPKYIVNHGMLHHPIDKPCKLCKKIAKEELAF